MPDLQQIPHISINIFIYLCNIPPSFYPSTSLIIHHPSIHPILSPSTNPSIHPLLSQSTILLCIHFSHRPTPFCSSTSLTVDTYFYSSNLHSQPIFLSIHYSISFHFSHNPPSFYASTSHSPPSFYSSTSHSWPRHSQIVRFVGFYRYIWPKTERTTNPIGEKKGTGILRNCDIPKNVPICRIDKIFEETTISRITTAAILHECAAYSAHVFVFERLKRVNIIHKLHQDENTSGGACASYGVISYYWLFYWNVRRRPWHCSM